MEVATAILRLGDTAVAVTLAGVLWALTCDLRNPWATGACSIALSLATACLLLDERGRLTTLTVPAAAATLARSRKIGHGDRRG